MKLNERQKKILQIVKENGPITGEQIASALSLTRATLRPDLSILTMTGMLEARPRVGYMYVGKKNASMLHEKLDTLTVGEFCPAELNDTLPAMYFLIEARDQHCASVGDREIRNE